MGSGSMAGEVLVPTGARFADGVEDATADSEGWEQTMSTENLTSVLGDADVVLYSVTLDGDTTDSLDALMDSAAFGDLDAAKEGAVFPLGKGTIAGYTDAFDILDNVDDLLESLNETNVTNGTNVE